MPKKEFKRNVYSNEYLADSSACLRITAQSEWVSSRRVFEFPRLNGWILIFCRDGSPEIKGAVDLFRLPRPVHEPKTARMLPRLLWELHQTTACTPDPTRTGGGVPQLSSAYLPASKRSRRFTRRVSHPPPLRHPRYAGKGECPYRNAMQQVQEARLILLLSYVQVHLREM